MVSGLVAARKCQALAARISVFWVPSHPAG